MGLTLTLSPGTLPNGTEFSATPQALLNLFAQYLAISGGSGFIPVNFGSSTPGSGQRGYPWFKTDGPGNPLGWYSWNGSAWVLMPVVPTTGNTASRPAGAQNYQLYYDTDIARLLYYDGVQGKWVTADGARGELRFVTYAFVSGSLNTTPSSADVLTANPGWSLFPTGYGRNLIAAGAGVGLTVRANKDVGGEESHVLVTAELAAHTHTVVGSQKMKADGNTSDAAGILASSANTNSGSTGSDQAHNNMSPFYCAFALLKD